MKENVSKQNFYHDMQEVIGPSNDQQKKAAEELTKIKTTGNGKLGKTILCGLEIFDGITQSNNEN